jgi:hypothetical protein
LLYRHQYVDRLGILLTETPWGAYPGHARNDIVSGAGIVQNSRLLSRSQKSVVHAPLAPFPAQLSFAVRTDDKAFINRFFI